MRSRVITIAMAAGLIAVAAIAPSQATPSKPNYNTKVRAVINVYCAGCHTGAKAQDGVDFSKYKTETAAKADKRFWMKVKATLTKKSMPPKDQPQPSAAKVKGMLEWIDSTFPAK